MQYSCFGADDGDGMAVVDVIWLDRECVLGNAPLVVSWLLAALASRKAGQMGACALCNHGSFRSVARRIGRPQKVSLKALICATGCKSF